MSRYTNQSLMPLALALTIGDPTGVGPEISVKAISKISRDRNISLVVIGDRAVLIEAAKRFCPAVLPGIEAASVFFSLSALPRVLPDVLTILSLSDFDPARLAPGRPDASEGRAMRQYIEAAVELARNNLVQAMVTGPINKAAMLKAGSQFGGHTELLASLTRADHPVMLLDNGVLRVALVTTHLPLADVPSALSVEKITRLIEEVDRGLKIDFGIARPRIAVTGLNPHAGEEAALGREENEIIAPAVKLAAAKGIDARGPYSADSIFHRAIQREFDTVICMYHDQGLIPIKLSGLDTVVNVTLGLPIVRTSVGHGTAPDIAWRGLAREDSLIRAIQLAEEIAVRRNKWHKKI